MTTYEMLQELLAQNEFELLLPKERASNTTEQDLRLVYQMNDTIESFLVFREAVWTGIYKEDYEGELEVSYGRDNDRYVLGVRQGDSVITLFYRKLELEVNLYNYGEIAHFWVPRYENLRQLEFRIAVLWDKYTYLGEDYCSAGEKRLVHLADVPALNFCSYCAAPEQYMVPHEMPKESFLQGLDVMEELAGQANDWLLIGWIRFFRRHSSPPVTKWMAHILHHSIHFGFVKVLTETIKKETAIYPRRSFGESGDARLARCLEKAQARKKELEASGAYVEIVRQEPFTIVRDQLDLKVYLLISRRGIVNQKVRVEEIY